MTISKTSLAALALGSVALGSVALAGTALAASITPPPGVQSEQGEGMRAGIGGFMRPVVVGTVSTMNGTTLTVSAKSFQRPATPGTAPTALATTYTVDASAATVTKAGAASTVSAIAVGDTVMIQGTVTGTNVVATKINDGVMGRGAFGQKPSGTKPVTPAITGNGQPVVGGKVTAVSGSTVTITNASNVTYTIDATNATVTKGGVPAATLSNVVVGDTLVVQGTVNGTSVTASSVIDQGAAPSATSGSPAAHRGILSSIGGFFAHLFGF